MAKKNKKDRKKKINRLIAPLTSPKQVNREVRAATRLQFRPTYRQIKGEKRASRQQSRAVKSWHKQHRNQLSHLRAQGVKVENRAVGRANQQQALSGAQDATNREVLAAEERRSAAIRGVAPDTAGQSASIEAAGQRRNIAALGANRADQQGQANSSLLGQINAAATLGRNKSLRDERNVRRSANADLRELAQKKGDFKVDYRAKTRQSERDWNLQNRTLKGKSDYNKAIQNVAAAGLAGKQASAAATTAAAELYSGAKIKSAKIYGRTSGGKGGKAGKPITGADINRASSYVRSELRKSGKDWRYVKKNQNAVVDYLRNRGVDPRAAKMTAKRFVRLKQKRARKKHRKKSGGLGATGSGSGSAGTN